MKTWSIEETIIRAQSLAAVAMQGVWDMFTHRPAYANDHPIPGCPNPSDCRGFGCAGDCFEALEAPTFGDDDEEVSEPAGCPADCPTKGLHETPDGQYLTHHNVQIVPGDPGGGDTWTFEETPNPYEPGLSDDELVALRGLIQERYENPTSNLAAGARAAGSSPSEVSGPPPVPPSEGCPDPSRSNRLASVRGEGGAPDSGIQQSPGAPQPELQKIAAIVGKHHLVGTGGDQIRCNCGDPLDGCSAYLEHDYHVAELVLDALRGDGQLDWHGWAEPAVMEVLADHYIEHPTRLCRCGDCDTFDLLGWREHVAELIASRLACDPARAIAALHNHKPQ